MKTTLPVLSKMTLLSIMLLFAGVIQAQETTESHHTEQGQHIEGQHMDSTTHQNQGMEEGVAMEHTTSHDTDAGFSDFPNLHPLVVHVPIMLLILAALIQRVSFFVFRRELSWVVLFLTVFGFIGALASGVWVHPETANLPDSIHEVLEEHETYAMWTMWLSGIASLLKIVSHFVFDRKTWAEVVVALVLISSAVTVSLAGHHGAQLVFIEGVGPQGKYLGEGEHEHSH